MVSKPRLRTVAGADGIFVFRAPLGTELWITGGGAEQTLTVPIDGEPEWNVEVTLDAAPR